MKNQQKQKNRKKNIFEYVETQAPKFRNWLLMWDVQVLWQPHLLSNLCPHSLVHPVIQLLFKSSHSLLNVFAKFKPVPPAGVNHSCSNIPAEKLSKEVSQITTETSGSGFVGRSQDWRGHGHSHPPFIFQPHFCPSANCQASPAKEKKRGMCLVF